jgi:hypothetical protein
MYHNSVTNLIHFHNHFIVSHPKTASVVPPEDGCLTPETCRGLRHNKVIVKVYYVGYTTVIHNDTQSIKYQIYICNCWYKFFLIFHLP